MGGDDDQRIGVVHPHIPWCIHKGEPPAWLPACSLSSLQKVTDGKKVVVVLDPKRSNAINIGLTVLPPVHIIKTAVLNFDEFAVSKEGIEVRTGESRPTKVPVGVVSPGQEVSVPWCP